MTNEEQLVESHVREYESRLRHIDELIARASKTDFQKVEYQSELSDLKQKRNKLSGHLDEIKALSAEEWAKKGGPMVIWDIVAERLEKLVEYLEGTSKD